MRDRVADVLTQRAALDRGAGLAVTLSILMHGALVAFAVYVAMHTTAPTPATFVSIKFAPMQATEPPRAAARATRTETPKPVAPPKVEEPKPKIEEPKPVVEKPAAKPEKNTVPLSPFGKSTKKGAETPAPATPKPAAPAASTSTAPPGVATTTADIPVGGTGITGLEGGDFPYAIYLQAMNRKIGGVWARPQITPATPTVIFFRIERDGRISESKLISSSGNPTFDRAALSAVRSASPLNALPFNFSGTYLGVTLGFK